MWILKRLFVYVLALILITLIVYYLILSTSVFQNDKHWQIFKKNENETKFKTTIDNKVFNIWCIFTKVIENAPFQYKFQNLVNSIVKYTSNPIHIHIISDAVSEKIASKILNDISNRSYVNIKYTFYDITSTAQNISDIVDTMTPYFSSQPGKISMYINLYYVNIFLITGTYYSDALFYLSLGLYRIAPESQDLAIMIDCDVEFRKDVALLYEEFKKYYYTYLFFSV